MAKQAREEIKRSQHKHFGAELVLKTFNCFKDLLSNLSKFYQESKFRKDKQQTLAIVVYGGFHLVDLIITELKGHMTSYKFECSHWLKLQYSDWRANLVKDFFYKEIFHQ